MLEEYNEFEMNGQKFSVNYEKENNIIWAVTYVDEKQIKKHGDSRETAYWAIKQAIYQELKLG